MYEKVYEKEVYEKEVYEKEVYEKEVYEEAAAAPVHPKVPAAHASPHSEMV